MTDRRRVLQAVALTAVGVVALPGCGSNPETPPSPSPTPDDQQAQELALIAGYDAALTTAGPAVRVLYQRLRAEHVAHLKALGWAAAPPSPDNSAGTGRRALLRAERRAVRSRTEAARSAEDPERAQILALIAASEAQHVVSLEAL